MALIIFSHYSKTNDNYGVNNFLSSLKKRASLDKKNKIIFINKKNFFSYYKKIKQSDLVHLHGCWSIIHLIVFLLSKYHKKKIFFSPHGMLNPEALKIKKIKKKIGWLLYQKMIIKNCEGIVVNSGLEKIILKKYFFSKKIYIIPHGIFINEKAQFKKVKNKNIKCVFYSRIHPIKGLHQIVDIWKNSKILKEISLDIYGIVEDKKYFDKIYSNIKNLNNVKYIGPLNKNNIYKSLVKYDVLIYPSFSENFGIVILEALNAGLFVLIRKGLPWKNLSTSFGKLIKIDKFSIEKNISFLNQKTQKIRLKYLRGNFVKKYKKIYDWDEIYKLYLSTYKLH